MNTDKLIESIFVGDVKPNNFYGWASSHILTGQSSENIDILVGIASEKNPSKEELIQYFKYALRDIGSIFPEISRNEYLENRFKAEFEKLIFSITEDELLFIANADHAQDIEKHYIALKHLIFQRRGIYSKELVWYPYECIELCRWLIKKGHEREFAICNCIIAQSVIVGADIDNDTNYMLSKLMPEYRKLPEELSKYVIEHVRFSTRCQ